MATSDSKHPLTLRLFWAVLAGVTALAVLGSSLPARQTLDIENFEVSTFLPYESCAGTTGFRVLGTECQPQVAQLDNLSIQFLSTQEEPKADE